MENLPMNQSNFGISKTMSSREIAELTGKLHKNVIQDIRNLIKQGAIDRLKIQPISYKDTYGREQPEYLLDFDTTMTLLGRYGMSYLKAKKTLVNHGLMENNAMTTSIVSTPNHSNFGKTMSSREIAELTGKLHFHVMRDIKTLIEQGAINQSNFGLVEYKDAKGEKRPMYLLDFDATMTLVTGYNAVLRAKVIRRWRELETERYKMTPAIPKDLPTALRAYANEIEKNQKLIAENTELREKNLTQGLTIAHNRDNIQFALNVRQSSDTCLIGTLAKYLKRNGCDVGQNRLFQWMRDNGYLCSTKGERWNLPTQMAQNAGLFGIRMNTYTKEQEERTHINHTPVLTMKGMQYFVKLFLGKEYDGSTAELKTEISSVERTIFQNDVTCIEDLTWED